MIESKQIQHLAELQVYYPSSSFVFVVFEISFSRLFNASNVFSRNLEII